LFLFFGLIVGIEGGRESSDGKTFGRNESSVISHKLPKAMKNDRVREKMDELNNTFKTVTNEAYFGPPADAATPPVAGP